MPRRHPDDAPHSPAPARNDHAPSALGASGARPRHATTPPVFSPGEPLRPTPGLTGADGFATRAEAFARLIPLGVLTPATAARLLHLPGER